MRTTIDIPDELFREAKLRAVQDGLRLKELFRRYVEQGLSSGSTTSTPVRKRNRSELPVILRASGNPLPDLSNTDVYRIMADEDADEVDVIGHRSS
jgi:hypothetical protein